jgi:hypothetical protein
MFIRQTVKILLLIFLLALLTAVTQTGGIVLLCTIGIIFFFFGSDFHHRGRYTCRAPLCLSCCIRSVILRLFPLLPNILDGYRFHYAVELSH